MYEQEAEVVRRIRERFPEESDRTDAWHLERGWDKSELGDAPHLWVEAFADRTTEAARARDWDAVAEQTDFMASEYRNGAGAVKNLVEVAYAENLLWNLEAAAKVAAWPRVSEVIRSLYEGIWGEPGRTEVT